MKTPKSLKLFMEQLESVKGDLYLIMLFGSHARGEAKRYSDIDLLIVTSSNDKEVHDAIIEIAEEAMASAGYEDLLAPHVISLSHYRDIQNIQTDFYRTLVSEGKELWKAA